MRKTAKALFAMTMTALLLAVGQPAQAGYVEADDASPPTTESLGTHVVIAGQGLEAGLTWLKAAQTQVLIYADRKPHGRIHLISAVNPKNPGIYLSLLKAWGYQNITYHAEEFIGDDVVKILEQIPLIESVDFIGHDGGFLGFALEDEGPTHRFYKAAINKMAGHVRFSANSFIRFLGCNTGWYLAPYAAKILGVPSSGTLTSADVEVLANDQIWYFDENAYFPKNLRPARQNTSSYSRPVNCGSESGCVRLHSVNTNYHGQHGIYRGALSFSKFFCAAVESSDCFRRMALSTRYAVGPRPQQNENANGESDFEQAMVDQFCPPSPSANQRSVCQERILKHLRGQERLDATFTTLPADVSQLSCDFNHCLFNVIKDAKGANIFADSLTGPADTLVRELDAYLQGQREIESSPTP